MSDLIARGMAAQAMPYNPAFLSTLGRPPRVLVIGESILADSLFLQRLQAIIPNAQVERRTYAGSYSSMGLLIGATDVQAQVTPGNLLPTSDFNSWGKTNTTVTATMSPSTGRYIYEATCAGVSQQGLSLQSGQYPTVPTGAPSLCFSVEVEPGSLQSFRITISNETTTGTIVQQDFVPANTSNRAGLLSKYIVVITSTMGVGYVAGNTLNITIGLGADESPTPWVAGTIYLNKPMLNVGVLPAPYFGTSGTAQSAGSQAWTQMDPGTDRKLYDLTIIQFGRNDANSAPQNNISALDHEKILSAIVSGISQYTARVMIVTPPPLANSSTPTAWSSSDYYQTNGLWKAAQRVAYKHGCYLYDAWTDFQNLVSSGVYAVSDLMRDQYHPTNATLSSPGMQTFIKNIANVLNSSKDSPVRSLGVTSMARIGGTPGGSFAWTTLSAINTPSSDPYGVLLGHQKEPYIGAYQSTTANDTLTFAVTGTIIGLIVVNDINTAGQMTVTVDSGATMYGASASSFTINTNNLNEQMYPLAYIVATGLPNTSHTVQVKNVSGKVWVMACVAC